MDNRAFWDAQASRGVQAGSRDLIAKRLEIDALAAYVRGGMRVLDVGCGNGTTALELARRLPITVHGLDSSPAMIRAANEALAQYSCPLKGHVKFHAGDVRDISRHDETYDLAYTERALINLPDWSSQRQAITDILQHVLPGGRYVMCENSHDGLERLNRLRHAVGLSAIVPPWHNRYLQEAEVHHAHIPGAYCETSFAHTSTYYVMSRVINAWLAHLRGREPKYDALVNRLASRLPSLGNIGQGRIWVWRRHEDSRV